MLLLLLITALCGGCATKALWSNAYLDAYNELAENGNLLLFDAKEQKDLLVVYGEYSERSDKTRARAYLLNRNEERIRQRQRPHFKSTKLSHNLKPISVVYATNVLEARRAQELYAVRSTNTESFTLYSGECLIESHMLPVYNDGKGQIERIVLTPIAVVADITIVGGLLGCLYIQGMAEQGDWTH